MTKACACAGLLFLSTLLPAVNAFDLSKSFAYATHSVVQFHMEMHCVYPDPYVDAPAPIACVGDIARIQHAHVYGNHTRAAVSVYDVVTGEHIGNAPSYTMVDTKDEVICVTGPLRAEYVTICWDNDKCPEAGGDCTCGSYHSEGKHLVADGCSQPDSPIVAIMRHFKFALGLA